MKIIARLVILTLSLLLVNVHQYCDNFIKQYNTFRSKCSLQSLAITSCCDVRIVSAVSGVYKVDKGTFNSADVHCDMNTTTGNSANIASTNPANVSKNHSFDSALVLRNALRKLYYKDCFTVTYNLRSHFQSMCKDIYYSWSGINKGTFNSADVYCDMNSTTGG